MKAAELGAFCYSISSHLVGIEVERSCTGIKRVLAAGFPVVIMEPHSAEDVSRTICCRKFRKASLDPCNDPLGIRKSLLTIVGRNAGLAIRKS